MRGPTASAVPCQRRAGCDVKVSKCSQREVFTSSHCLRVLFICCLAGILLRAKGEIPLREQAELFLAEADKSPNI